MKFSVVIERVPEHEIGAGYYYAHVPALGLTTHGYGIDGARAAAQELTELWVAEKKANNEEILDIREEYYSIMEIDEYAL